MRGVLYLVLLLGMADESLAQRNYQSRFFIDAGIIGRTTVFYAHGLRDLQSGPLINTQYPYDYRAGINGLGISVTPSLLISRNAGIVVDWGSTFRYDFYYWDAANQRVYTFYLDQSISLKKKVFGEFYIGAGFTLYNLGKELDRISPNTHPPNDDPLKLQFNSIDFMSGVLVNRVIIEGKISIVQQDFPGTVKDNAILLHGRICYRINFGRNKERIE